MRNFLAACFVFTMIVWPLAQVSLSSPALAESLAQSEAPDDGGKTLKEAERLARETAERLMNALRLMLEFIPQYEMPEITDEGDIIIRRKRKAPEPEQENGDTSKT